MRYRVFLQWECERNNIRKIIQYNVRTRIGAYKPMNKLWTRATLGKSLDIDIYISQIPPVSYTHLDVYKRQPFPLLYKHTHTHIVAYNELEIACICNNFLINLRLYFSSCFPLNSIHLGQQNSNFLLPSM